MEIPKGRMVLLNKHLTGFWEPGMAGLRPWKSHVMFASPICTMRIWLLNSPVIRSKRSKSNNKNTQVWAAMIPWSITCSTIQMCWQKEKGIDSQPRMVRVSLTFQHLLWARWSWEIIGLSQTIDPWPKTIPQRSRLALWSAITVWTIRITKGNNVWSEITSENNFTKRGNIQREIDTHGFQGSRSQGSYFCLLWGKDRKAQTKICLELSTKRRTLCTGTLV